MIIESIRLKNFLSHEDSTIEFADSPLWLVSGENGAGKSAFFDAVGFSFYGVHRGGSQQSNLLVKQGTERGLVEIVLQLAGDTYRVRHTLDHARGNIGSTLEQRSDTGWVRVAAGGSARQVCAWLQERLPDEQLFFSAIYLRQGEADAFMRGNAKERMKRFASLLSLDRYTELSIRAGNRRKRAEARAQDARSKLETLGDISEVAVEALGAQVEIARRAESTADCKLSEARKVHDGAKAWKDLNERRDSLVLDRTTEERLLQEAATIRADADAVGRWDAASADLAMYWEHRDVATRNRTKAQKHGRRACEFRQQADAVNAELTDPIAELERLEHQALPAARRELECAEHRIDAASLELRIAKTREEHSLRARAALLLSVHAVVDAFQAHHLALEKRVEAERACESTRDEQKKAKSGLDAAEAEVERCEAACRRAQTRRHELNLEIERLNGQIIRHEELGEETPVCPMCAQEVGPEAREHLHQALQEEREVLSRLEERCPAADQAERDTENELRAAKTRRLEAERRLRRAEATVSQADGELARCGDRVDGAQRTWQSAYEELVEHHPDFIEPIAVLTHAWLDEAEEDLAAGLPLQYIERTTLAAARGRATSTLAELEMLRRQRGHDALPLGETQSVSVLETAHFEARSTAEELSETAQALELQREILQGQAKELATRRDKLHHEATTEDALAASAFESAETAEGGAHSLEPTLSRDWSALLADRSHYEAARAAIDGRRENAAKRSKLDQAEGRLRQIKADLKNIDSQIEVVPDEHRVSVQAADAAEKTCNEALRAAQERRMLAEADLQGLEKRRKDAETYRAAIDEATEEARTFGQLETLLREGGPLQVQVAQEEQRAVVEEVNAVLQLIDDPLRAHLGEPQRGAKDTLRDIVVVDTTDPVQQPRYFNYLSGGERFRVALALALALHRRVDAGVPGTLIIDEGFGALDGERRDELARQLADTVEGLLARQLAESIIVSSHSTEVQRHFRFRWEVTKEDGVARVRRYFEPEGLVDE